MAEKDSLVEQLQNELRHEAFTRHLQEELNSKLQDEYDELLKRLAEAELHIDRMRLGANVDLNKYFIIRHHTEHHNTLRQRLEAQFDPAWRQPLQPGNDISTKSTVKSTGVGTEGSPNTHQDDTCLSVDHIKDGKRTSNTPESHTSNDVLQTRGSSSELQNIKDSRVAATRYVPLSPKITDSSGNSSENETSLKSPNDRSSQLVETSASAIDSSSSTHFNDHHTSNGFRGLKGHQNIQSESQELLLQSSNLSPSSFVMHTQLISSHTPSSNNAHLSSTHNHTSSYTPSTSHAHLNSSHHHTSSSYTSTDEACLSQMSASTIEIRGSTESMQLAHLFKIHSLQEELDHLKSKLNDRSVPLDEIVRDASHLHQEHQQLVKDVEALSTNLDALRKKNNGKISDRIVKSKRAIENELAKLGEQFQELYSLLCARAEEEGSNLSLPRTSTSSIERKDSDSQLYDSLNSPYLPTKYLNHETSTGNQLPSPQGAPLFDGSSPSFLLPSHSSTPHESNSSAHLTNSVFDNKVPSKKLKDNILPSIQHSEDSDIGNNDSKSDEIEQNTAGSCTPLERLIELGASGHVAGSKDREQRNLDTLSDLSDILPSDEDELHLPKDTPNRSDRSPIPSDLSHMNPVPSPDSLYLQEAKTNLKRAKELGYSNNSHSSRDDHSSPSISQQDETTTESHADATASSSTLDTAAGIDGRKNALSLRLSNLKDKPSQIPRLIQSQHSPRPHLRGPSSNYARYGRPTQNSSTTATHKDQTSTTFPGEGDSGFAGSELPSRTATRMDTSSLEGRERGQSSSMASSVLQSTISEDDANQQRFVEATAAIEALRKELADLKLQMMRNVKRSDSIPKTPSLHSHSTKGPTFSTITTSRLNSHDYLSSSSQPKLPSREFSNGPSASASSLRGSEAPSSHHTLTGGRSSQMTTNANTPSQSAKSTISLSHTYFSQGDDSTTAVTNVDLTPRSSPSRQSSSVRLSTPALSSFISLRSTPIPTPQHSMTGHTMSNASTRPNSIANGRYVGQRNPLLNFGYASSYTSDHPLSQVPGYDRASDHYESDNARYYHSSQSNSVATAPSTIRSLSNRGSVNQYQPPSYEEASMLESLSNVATLNSSLASAAITAPIQEPSDTEGCATEIDPSLAGYNNMCGNCGERTQFSHNGTRSSDGSVTQRHNAYLHGSNVNPSHEQSQSHHSVGNRGAEVGTANAIVQSDHEVHIGHGPQLRSKDVSRLTSFDGAQRPMATSTPSRRSAVLNTRHAQTAEDTRERFDGRFKLPRDLPARENFTGVPAPSSSWNDIAASRARPNLDVASSENNSPRYSVASHYSPQRKKSDGENFAIYSTHSSPAHTHTHGYRSGSGVSSSVQSSPGHGYSSARRASTPALYDGTRKKLSGGQIMDGRYDSARHSDYRVGHPEESSSDSEGRYHNRDAYLSSEGGHGEMCTTHDDKTPHLRMPMSGKHAGIRSHKPSHPHDYYSDPETSPEHHYQRMHGRTKPRLVKVIETPKQRKKRVVYLASERSSPEEIYYPESGLFTTPRQPSRRRRVVSVVGSRNRGSMSRGEEGVRVARIREGVRPRKVYVEQPSEPVEKVYIVERESGSDLDQLETFEMHDLDLEDTLRLAHELKRRTRRLQGTLHAELERQAFY